MSLWDPPKDGRRDPLPFMEAREFTPEEQVAMKERIDAALAEMKPRRDARTDKFKRVRNGVCCCPCCRRY